MLKRLLLALPIAALVLAQPQAQAPQWLGTLADSASVVVTGRVVQTRTAHDGSAIYTYVTLQVAEVLKGTVPDKTLVFKQLGGVTATLGLHIDGQARFAAGDDVLVFLAVRPRDGTLYTAGLSTGAWRVLPSLQNGLLTAVQKNVVMDLADLSALAARSATHDERFVATPAEAPSLDTSMATPSFTFLAEGPARWHQADDGGRIPVNYQTVPGSVPGGVGTLDAAIAAWNGVGATLGLDRGGTGAPSCPYGSFTGNGAIGFYWNDPCGEIGDGDTATIGIGGGYFTPGSTRTVNGVVFQQMLQGIAVVNNANPLLATTACFQDAAVHVLGHAIGLGDSSDGNAVMFQTLRAACSGGASGIGSDDRNGVRAIYPAIASGGEPPVAPTAISAAVTLDTVVLNWTPSTAGGPAQSYIVEAGSAPGLANLAVLTIPNASTTTTVGAVPSGLYYVRVRARNALGVSLPSPDTAVTVGSCSTPGSPSALAYSTADNLVTITWAPPTSGGPTQRYVLSAGFGPGQSNALVATLGPTPAFGGSAPYGNYYVRVQAGNSCSIGPASADLLVSVVPCSVAPQAPTRVGVAKAGNVVTLQWTAPASGPGASRYRLVVGSTAGAADLLVLDTTNNITSFVAAAPNGTYFVKIQSLNACGASAYSNEEVVSVP